MPGGGLRDRTTADVVTLLFATTVTTALILAAVTIAVVEVTSPETDTTLITENLYDVLKILLGAVLGYLAGRAPRSSREAEEA
jgi:hypothetical protein